ncbi:MAG: alpha/beta hydrolase [Planctomycetota bacterium]
MRSEFPMGFLPRLAIAGIGVLLVASMAVAQAPTGKAPPAAKAPPAGKSATAAKAKGPVIPPREEVRLETRDKVQLSATYYPGWKENAKESVPVVLLHGWKGSRRDFTDLAQDLHSVGHAVLVPDLRGHGDSTSVLLPGRTETLSAATLTPQQFQRMGTYDMGAVKDFLWNKHNEGQLNLNRLVVVGAEMGASAAVDFAHVDWSTPDYGPLQLGKFVKGLVLISPEYNYRGMNMRAALGNQSVLRDIAVLILVGRQDSRAITEANRIHGIFERYHPEPEGSKEEVASKRTLWLGPLDTRLQGTGMLSASKLRVGNHIGRFIELRAAGSPQGATIEAWKPLKKPHE